MNTPFVSFVIPFYGSVPLLKRALDSILAQTDGDFEAVVVDDRSPERAEALVAQYDARFRYILQPENKGSYQGRLRGMQEAVGEYLVDVDCDDYVLPELVAEIRKAAEANGSDVIAYNLEQDYDGRIEPHWCRYGSGTYSPQEALDAMAEGKFQWCVFARAIRKSVAEASWAAEPRLLTLRVLAADDYAASIPMILKSRRIETIPYVGYRYYQSTTTANSISHSFVSFRKTKRAILQTLEVRRLLLDFAKHEGFAPRVRADIRAVARKIVRWWAYEFLMSFKKRLGHGIIVGKFRKGN